MSTHNICFNGEIRKIFSWYPLTLSCESSLNIVLFQAYAGSSSSHRPDTTLRAEPQPSTSRGHVRTETDAQGTFVAPLVSRHSSTSSSGGRVGNSSHSSNQSHAANNSRASNLLNRTSSSSSSYPSSLSGYEGNRSSASLSSGNFKYEPVHDKTYKMACAPSKDSDQPGHPLSDQSSLCAQSVAKDPSFLHADSKKTLIKLGGCPGWSESLLGTHVIL